MKCPYCGQPLRPSKKEDGYMVCDTCRKKFSVENLQRRQAKKPPHAHNTKEKSKRPFIIAVSMLLILVIILVLLFTRLLSSQSKVVDLSGTWRSEDNNGTYQEAVISDGTIIINWVSDGGDTYSLYWYGSYEVPEEATTEYSWISEADVTQTESALLASQDTEKEFTYKDGIISYSASALGTTTTVKLEKID